MREQAEQWLERAKQSLAGRSVDDRIGLLESILGKQVCRQLGIFRLPEGFRLSVVIPVYNEVATLEKVLRRVRETDLPCEIIVVDDGSTDGTRALLESWRDDSDLTVVLHESNQGKGAALKSGFARARGDVVIVQDADLEYHPDDFRRLIRPIVEDEADVVYGSRFSSPERQVPQWHHIAANGFLTWLSNLRNNLKLTDMETCYKAVRRDVIQRVGPTLQEKRFGVEPELTAKLARVPGIRFYEVPISYTGRSYAEGKKIGFRDGLRAIWCIIRY